MESMFKVKQVTLKYQRCLVALAVLVFSLPSIAQDDRIPLPDMGNSASTILSEKEEQEYAKAMIRQMRAYEVLVEDPQINAYFQNMGFQIVAHSDRPGKDFHFVVLDQLPINAFAAPGGLIALHTGLILAAESEHEVAGVLAHEVAHITQLHMYRAFENSKRMTLPVALAMLGLILVGGGGGDVISGALMGGQAMTQQMRINFTRANEHETDRIGITTLARAVFDPQGMAGFFSKLGRLTRPNGEGPPEFLRTHPVTVNRIAEAKSRAQNLPVPEPADGLDFYLMQARVRALLAEKPAEAITWFEDQLRKDNSESQVKALNYGLAIALQGRLEFVKAKTILDELLNNDPNRLSYQLQIASLEMKLDEDDSALQRLADLYHSFPGNHAIAMQYSEALLHNEDPQQAETASIVLRQQIQYQPDDPVLYGLYAKAANIAGDKVRSIEAIAESYYQQGGVTEAIEQLERLSRDHELDYYQRARISARLVELRIEMVEAGEEAG